ncbi:hypothetical protein [Halobaculum sp. D14]|uniref:hypothetical protein n=1 Tax=unclassified Halobaculum TaxID=2640896 RepID=UPI003EC13395
MACPHLEYRDAANGKQFEAARAFCTVTDEFVQPVHADVCAERYGLDPESDCGVYRDHEGLEWDE